MVTLVSQENTVPVTLVSRTGRHLQRYICGRRQVVGCIPYRYKDGNQNFMEIEEVLEVLVISSQNGKGMLFPKGGWELDETKKQAAQRETIEEAGVLGTVKPELGKWSFKSRTHGKEYEGYMFPLLVHEQLDSWPEQNFRQRIWVNVAEAREVCKHKWMKEALDVLVDRLISERRQLDNKSLAESL